MDGRNISLFPDKMVAENLKFYSSDPRDADIDAPLRYDTDWLLVPAGVPVLARILKDGRWQRIYADADATLFSRADVAHRPVLLSAERGAFRPPVQQCPKFLQ